MVQYWVIIYFLAEIYKEQADRQIYFVRYLPVNCYKKLEETEICQLMVREMAQWQFSISETKLIILKFQDNLCCTMHYANTLVGSKLLIWTFQVTGGQVVTSGMLLLAWLHLVISDDVYCSVNSKARLWLWNDIYIIWRGWLVDLYVLAQRV